MAMNKAGWLMAGLLRELAVLKIAVFLLHQLKCLLYCQMASLQGLYWEVSHKSVCGGLYCHHSCPAEVVRN